MTMRTRYAIVCDCGHEGAIKLTENDQPFSEMYQSYSLENLKGSLLNVDSAEWNEVFSKMQITCPICKRRLTPKHFKG